MNLQEVMDELERAEEYARHLPETPLKRLLLTHLTKAQHLLVETSDELIAQLDAIGSLNRGIIDTLHSG